MKQSLVKFLSVITAVLVMMLVAVFANLVRTAYQRKDEAARILSLVTIKRDMLICQEAVRAQDAVLDSALGEEGPAPRATVQRIMQLHDRLEAAFARVRHHRGNEFAYGYDDILKRDGEYDRLLPVILSGVARPKPQRSQNLMPARIAAANLVLNALGRKSDSLSRTVSSTDPLMTEMLHVADLSWRARADAGNDRHAIMDAILAHRVPTPETLQALAERKGQIASLWALIESDTRLPHFPPAIRAAVARANWLYFTQFAALRADTIQILAQGRPVAFSAQEWIGRSNPSLGSLTAISDRALDLTEAHAADQFGAARRNFYIAIGLMLLCVALASFAAIYVIWRVIAPLRAITLAISAFSDGALQGDIPFGTRDDEIGQFARALQMFRDGALERLRLEKALVESRVAQESAETSSRVKSEFLANMSHELRTPLNAIIGFSDIMQHQLYGEIPTRYVEYVTLINEAGLHLLNLVSDILDLAKIEAGKFELDLREMDLRETVEGCLRLTQRRAEEKGVALLKDLPQAPLTLTADARALKQILLNLLSNAVKFTRAGGSIEVAARPIGGDMRISVRDTGIGIPPDVLSRIGNAFEQGSNDPMLAREGTGLGLALVRALVGQHGGRLSIESKEQSGTCVTVDVPLAQPGRAAA